MKYPPAPLTPFLAALPQNPPHRFRPHSLVPRTAKALSAHSSIACALFELSCRSFFNAALCFQSLAHSFAKHRGGVLFCDTSALSTSLYPEPRGVRYRCSRWIGPLFSRTYELPPATHRFASRAFSCTYKLLFSQLACFHKHLRCPLLFSLNSQFFCVAQLSSLPPYFLRSSLPASASMLS